MSRVVARDEEAFTGPLSPELVLVSPDLRAVALERLEAPRQRTGHEAHSDLLELARRFAERDQLERTLAEPSFLRAAWASAVRTTLIATVFVVAVAAVSFGLAIVPEADRPIVVSPPDPTLTQPPSPSIGTAVFTAPRAPAQSLVRQQRDRLGSAGLEQRLEKRAPRKRP